MSKFTLPQLRRMEKLEETVHDLCEKGKRDPEHYLDILQAINDGRQVEVVAPMVFLSLSKQFQGFIAYNQWLKESNPGYVISEKEMAAQQAKLAEINSDGLIFYCHEGDVVLTAKLAWEYICSYRQKAWESEYVRFENGYMKADDREPVRPSGFYAMKRPVEDKGAIGKKFQSQPMQEVRQKLGNDWGMGCEGIQFVGITHPHYPELMNGRDVPFIDLPGLAISPYAGDVFGSASGLNFHGGGLGLRCDRVGAPYSGCGSGSLQQC